MLSNIIAKLRQEGALSTNVYHENNSRQHGMCLGEHYITGLKTETNKQKQKKKKKEYTIKNEKTISFASITKKALVNKYRDIKMDISYRSPYYSSIRLCLRSSITIIHVKIKRIMTFIT